ncbi:hypothetical protein [Helicobacter labacensis]|uniref:hypothetical protein n=1 Tax=Helicobacter labacensis TaxID=2316079 RepID=UPI000EAEED50|nr:hypothetical protein [Helicobacter labacensis]
MEISPSVWLALGAGGLVGAHTHHFAWLKAGLVAMGLVCPLPFGSHLSLGALIVGLFGEVSALSLLLVGGAWGGRYLGFSMFSMPCLLFLSIFGGVIFLDALGLLPFSLLYAPFAVVWGSLCLWGGGGFLRA